MPSIDEKYRLFGSTEIDSNKWHRENIESSMERILVEMLTEIRVEQFSSDNLALSFDECVLFGVFVIFISNDKCAKR